MRVALALAALLVAGCMSGPQPAPSTGSSSTPAASTPVTSTPVTSTPATSTPASSTPAPSTPAVPAPTTPPQDVCAPGFSWRIVTDEIVREAVEGGAALVFRMNVQDANATTPVRDVAWSARYGANAQDARAANGTLDALAANGSADWRYDDTEPVGVVSPSDTMVLFLPGAAPTDLWSHIDLYDRDGHFIGGTARCA